jgi:hypothetical protein
MLIAGIVYLIAYRMRLWGLGSKKTILPETAKYGSWLSQIVEASILACILSAVVIFWVIVRFQWYKSNTPHEILTVHKLFIAGLAVSIVMAFLAALWRTSLGFWIAVVVAFVGLLYGGRSINPERLVKKSYENDVAYTIIVNNHPGADIWVNDVYLGKSPIQISLKEFIKKVPYWPEPPQDINNKIGKKSLAYRDYGGWGTQSQSQWIEFRIPRMPESFEFSNSYRRDPKARAKRSEKQEALKQKAKDPKHLRTYYARTQLGDAVGYGNFHGGDGLSGSHSSRGSTFRGECRLEVDFPLRDLCIEKLLDVARMSDYEVDDTWLNAMSSYGNDGWQALHRHAYRDWIGSGKLYYRWLTPQVSEPGILKVMNAWASRRYGLNEVTNKESAWDVFRELCSSADSNNDYSTNSLEGHALGLLLSKINHEQLVECAKQLIRTRKFRQMAFYTYSNWTQQPIEYPKDEDHRKALPSDYLIVDAILRLDRYLDSIDDTSPNIIERQVSKAILFWQGPVNFPAFRLAVDIGGPDLAPYLTKCWQGSLRGDSRFRHGFSTSSIPDDVNLWLFLLARMNGDQGKEFRSEYADDVLKLIEQISEDRFRETLFWGTLDFISKDVELGDQCVGAKYWPEYFQLVKNSAEDHQNDKLQRLWSYPIRIEPVMPAETYVRCWRETEDRHGKFRRSLHLLEVLPAEKQRLVLKGLKEELKLRPDNIKDRLALTSKSEIGWLQKELDRMLAQTDDAAFAQYIIKDLQGRRYRWSIQDWLLQERPGHIVGEIMAESNDIKLRQISVKLLANHPTPHRMELLGKLTEDPYELVSTAARQAVEELDHFKSNITSLQAKTDDSKTADAIAPSEVVIRLYDDDQSNSEFRAITHPVEIRHDVQGLKVGGSLAFKAVEINEDSLAEVNWPGKGIAVICGIDQTSPAVKDMLSTVIVAWTLPSKHRLQIPRRRRTYNLLLCDAMERPIANTPLQVELKAHRTEKTVLISGLQSDNNGVVQMSAAHGQFSISAFIFQRPDYGIARIGCDPIFRDMKLVAPLLKTGAKEYERALFGTVFDQEGSPVGGAKVEVTGIKRDYMGPVNMYGKSVYTDRNGCFNIYPSGRNIRSKVPPKAQYRLRITAPQEKQLPPYSGLHANGEELTIRLESTGTYHTFSFETTDGPLTDEQMLNRIRLYVRRPDGTGLDFKRDYWKNGATLPLGTYEARLRDSTFIPLAITKDSPQHIVFRQEPEKTFAGRVVHGITGKPFTNAFVIRSTAIGEGLFSDLTSENWDKLHSLGQSTSKDDTTAKLIYRISPFDFILRTDKDGRFKIKEKPQAFYNFTVFDENFMPFGHRVNSRDIQGQTDIHLGDIKLFPAARVKLGVDGSESVSVIPFPVIGKDAPEWAKAYQEFVGFSYDRWHRIKEPRWIHVPAGVKFQLRLRPGYHSKWSPLLIERTIYLEQGQELDLGLVKFEPTIKVMVKVLDSEGKALEGALISLSQETGMERFRIGYTDHEGRIEAFVCPNVKSEFRVTWHGKTASQLFGIEDKNDAGDDFVITVNSEVH